MYRVPAERSLRNRFLRLQSPHDQLGVRWDARTWAPLTAVWSAGTTGAAWLALVLVTPFASLTGPIVQRVLLAIVCLDIPFQFEKGLYFRSDAAEFGGLAEFNVSVTTIALFLLYLGSAISRLTVPGRPPVRSAARISRPLALYLGFATLSTLTGGDVSLSLRELFLLVQTFLLYVYVVTWVRTREDVGFLLTSLLISMVLEGLVMFYGFHVGDTTSLPGVRRIQLDPESVTSGTFRVGGTVGSPTSAAAYMELLIAPGLAVLLARVRRCAQALAVGAAGIGAGALVITQSRAGWLAALLSIGVVWLASARRTGFSLVVPVAATSLIAVVLAFSQGTITERLSGDDQGSAQSRGPLMRTAMQMIQDHPVLGVGPNNYGTVMKQYGAVYGKWGDWVYTVHNKFLLVWAETGLGGLFAFLWFLTSTIRLGWKGWKAGDPWLSPFALGLTGALVGHMVHMQVDLFSARPQVEMLWVVAALVAVIHGVTRQQNLRVLAGPGHVPASNLAGGVQ